MGVFQALRAVWACALLLPPIGRGFTSQCLDIGGAGPGRGDRWAYPGCGLIFEPRQVALGAWQEVKGEGMSVNEAL